MPITPVPPSSVDPVAQVVSALEAATAAVAVTALTDRSSWVTTTAYAIGDVVTQGGQRYVCRVGHTSGTFATDLAASKWVSLDAVAALSSSRQVIAGTGLTGGGDLTADRTLAVAYGTTSGTAAQGNDSRITGAVQASNNLSDVTASSARSNLGLGTAATKNVGTTSSTVAAGDAPTTAAANATLAEAFGVTNGSVLSPWAPSATLGMELWQTVNMSTAAGYQFTSLIPSVAANGTTKTVKTAVALGYSPTDPTADGNLSPLDATFRVTFDYTLTVPNTGWAGIYLNLMTGGPATVSGVNKQYITTAASSRTAGKFSMDFRVSPTVGISTTFLEIGLETYNNSSTGSVSISNVSVKATGGVTRPMLAGAVNGAGAKPQVWWQFQDVNTQTWKTAYLSFGDDGALTPYAYSEIHAYVTDNPWSAGYVDPTFTRSTQAVTSDVNKDGIYLGSLRAYSLRENNNDQIISIETPGGTFDGAELYGNVHGGETARGSATLQVDHGPGWTSYTSAQGLLPVRRYQLNLPTQFSRAALNSGNPVANIDHLFTVFPDGVVRCDRTTTWLATVRVGAIFEWMTSHNLNNPMQARIGRGLTVLGYVDVIPKVVTPVISSVTTSASGGTLAAATYSYRVSATTAEGETLASTAVTVASTGTTSANTVNWSAVTGNTGAPSSTGNGTTTTTVASVITSYLIYGRVAGAERLLATVAPSATSWVDDGSALLTSTKPALFSTARYYGSTSENWVAADSSSSDVAGWAVWYDQRSGFCYGNIYDRDTVLARSGVTGVRLRLYQGKNYLMPQFADTGTYPSTPNRLTVSSGAVWTATHWSFCYIPLDTSNWHTEIALRAANLSALSALYPST